MQKTKLQEFVDGLSDEVDYTFKRCFISGISGRIFNNEMIVFAICIGYSECIEDYSFLFQFLILAYRQQIRVLALSYQPVLVLHLP